MSEIVLNYTGLDNAPGKIVFNKSSDYFEWLNRGKPKNVETLDVEIDEVKANGTYIKVPEKEGGYFDKVVMNVNVPRQKAVSALAFKIQTKSGSKTRTHNFSDMQVIDISSENELIGDGALLPAYEINDTKPKYITLGHITQQLRLTSTLENTVFLVMYSSASDPSYIVTRFYRSNSTRDIPRNSYVIKFTNGISSDEIVESSTFTYGFYSEYRMISSITTGYRQMFDTTTLHYDWTHDKRASNYSTVYDKCPTLNK